MQPLILALLLLACGDPSSPGGGGDGGAADGGSTDGGGDAGTPIDDGVSIQDAAATRNETISSIFTVSWTQTGSTTTWVDATFDGDTISTPPRVTADGEHHQIVLGAPYGYSVSWKLKYDQDGDLGTTDDVVTIGAGTLDVAQVPKGCPGAEIRVSEPDHWDPTGVYLLGSINENAGGWTGGHYWKFIIDRKGRLVWAHETPNQHWSIFLRVSVTGDSILWDDATYWAVYDGGRASTVHRWYLDGTEIEEIPTPGLHHAFTELPDGTLAWGAAADPYEDLVERAPGSKEIRTVWSCRDFHQANAYNGSCQSNTLYYDPERDTYLYSFYTTSTIVEIGRETGESLWWAGGVPNGYAFDPPESQWSWQHGCNYTDAGTLLTSTEDTYFGMATETLAREFEVDDAGRALHEVWNFGTGYGTYASTAGEATRLDNGNTLHNYGADGSIKEVTTAGDVVWEAGWGSNQLLGRTTLLQDLYALVPPSE